MVIFDIKMPVLLGGLDKHTECFVFFLCQAPLCLDYWVPGVRDLVLANPGGVHHLIGGSIMLQNLSLT